MTLEELEQKVKQLEDDVGKLENRLDSEVAKLEGKIEEAQAK